MLWKYTPNEKLGDTHTPEGGNDPHLNGETGPLLEPVDSEVEVDNVLLNSAVDGENAPIDSGEVEEGSS